MHFVHRTQDKLRQLDGLFFPLLGNLMLFILYYLILSFGLRLYLDPFVDFSFWLLCLFCSISMDLFPSLLFWRDKKIN